MCRVTTGLYKGDCPDTRAVANKGATEDASACTVYMNSAVCETDDDPVGIKSD